MKIFRKLFLINKLIPLIFLALYIFSPIDIIPEIWFKSIGYIDDILLSIVVISLQIYNNIKTKRSAQYEQNQDKEKNITRRNSPSKYSDVLIKKNTDVKETNELDDTSTGYISVPTSIRGNTSRKRSSNITLQEVSTENYEEYVTQCIRSAIDEKDEPYSDEKREQATRAIRLIANARLRFNERNIESGRGLSEIELSW